MKIRVSDAVLVAALILCASILRAQVAPGVSRIMVGAGRAYVVDTPVDVERVSVAAPDVAETVPVTNRTVMINGKTPGETSAILWLSDGTRKEYDVVVSFAASRMDAARQQIEREFSGSVQLTGDATAVYLTGTVKDMFASDRAQAIAATLGKVVNLLKVDVPPQEQEILIKVRFADVDRSKSMNLGANILGQPGGWPFNVTTGQNDPSRFQKITTGANGQSTTLTLADALNILMFDPHANLLATIQALQAQNVLQILDEPNVLAMNGHTASFLAGGEFPYPTLQGGGSGIGQVTISFRDFGIRLQVTPVITPRGTIRLHIAPEVSSLDYADALTVNGGTVPALTTRRVDTEVEVEDGQSFAIAGLLDRSTSENLSKIPGLGDIPVLGKLFTSKNITRANSELIVIVTPELVSPIPKDQPLPELKMPRTFLEGPDVATQAPRTPGTAQTGALPARPVRTEIPVQEMEKIQRDQAQAQQDAAAGQSPASFGSGNESGAAPGGGISLPAQTPASAAPAQQGSPQ